MKRFTMHLTVMLTTFSIGVVGTFVLDERRSHSSADENRQHLEPLIQDLPEAPMVNAAPTMGEFILNYDPKEFNPRGTYVILGRTPKDLREFQSLQIVVEERAGRPSGEAEIYTESFDNDVDYRITRGGGDYVITGLLTKERLTFVATPEHPDGFEFRFDGYFLRGGTVSNARRKEAVLKGKLTKIKDCVKVVESEVEFRVEYLGC